MLSTLLRRDFALLWSAGLISYLGNWALFTALAYFVFQQTGSALASSTVLTMMVAPLLLTSLAGVLVDRWDRKRILVVANLAMAVLTVPLLLASSGENLWLVYVSVFGVAFAGLVLPPAENALLPTLVGRDRLLTANSLNALNDNLGRIAGPGIGGVLVAVGDFATVVIFNAASYLIAALLISLIRLDSANAGPPLKHRDDPDDSDDLDAAAGLWQEWRAGLRVIQRSPVLTVVLVVAATALLGDAILSGLLAPFVAETLAADASVLGLLLSIRGVGGLLGGFVTGSFSNRLRPQRLMAACTIAIGTVLAVIVAMRSVPVVLVGAGVLGVLVVGWLASQQTLLQTHTADRYLGRVFGALGTVTAITLIIGSLIGGGLADTLGIPALLYVSAALYLAAGLIAVAGNNTLNTASADQ